MPTNDPRIEALKALEKFAQGFIPTNLYATCEPTIDDGKAIVSDLLAIARVTDNLIAAYGQYLRSHGIVSDRTVTADFTDQLLGALEGNATFVIEDGIAGRIEDREVELAEMRS